MSMNLYITFKLQTTHPFDSLSRDDINLLTSNNYNKVLIS